MLPLIQNRRYAITAAERGCLAAELGALLPEGGLDAVSGLPHRVERLLFSKVLGICLVTDTLEAWALTTKPGSADSNCVIERGK